MNIVSFVNTHGIEVLLAYFVFSALVSGMPAPKPTASTGYVWLYNSLHALSGDLREVAAKYIPGSQATASPTPSAPSAPSVPDQAGKGTS